jgi:hypothetical protein
MKIVKTFTAAAVVSLAVLAPAACSSSGIQYLWLDEAGNPIFPDPSKGQDGGTKNPSKDGATTQSDSSTFNPGDEEKTVGKLCKSDADCEVPNSAGDNVCSLGFFVIGDLYGDAVCVSQCKRGPGQSFADILCDGDDQGAPGICSASNPGEMGVCFPSCEFNSSTIATNCQGANKCTPSYFGTSQQGEVFSLGICLGNCTQDLDCKGTPGSKCQKELGLCTTSSKYVTYTKVTGQACNGTSPTDCNCNTVGGTGVNANRGYCSHTCLTGSAGDAVCNSKVAGWRCSAGLPSVFTDGKPAFNAQPAGILGSCAKPCVSDGDCTALAATVNTGGGTAVGVCEATAGGKICVIK